METADLDLGSDADPDGAAGDSANDFVPLTFDGLAREILGMRPFLHGRAQFLTQDPIAADDLVQDTLERALLSRVHFQSGTNLKGWLFAIMRNLFIDDRRRDLAQRRLSRALGEEPRESPWIEEPDRHEMVSLVDVVDSLEGLTARDREIFAMFYLRHLSYREIGSKMGMLPVTVGTRLLRSKLKVRAVLLRVIEARGDTDFPASTAHASL